MGQAYYGRAAKRAGFDDALLTGPDGIIAEGAITNIAFSDGSMLDLARRALPGRHHLAAGGTSAGRRWPAYPARAGPAR